MSATMNPGRGMQPMMRPMLTPQMASAAQNLAAMGSGRDSMLAHINPREAQILMAMGGRGNRNPRTGLPQFDDGGGGGDGSGGQTQTTSSAPGTFVDQPTPSGFVPSNIGYQGGVPDSSISPFDSALVSSYGASPSNAAPIDPAMFNYVNDYYATLGTPQGGTPTNPFLISTVPGAPDDAAQFLATPGNPDFTINPSGYADLSQQGLSAFDTYTAQQVATDEANAKKNESGLGAIFPEIVGGLVGAAGLAVGGEALLGGLGAAGDAAVTSGDVTGALEDVTSGDVTGALGGGFGSADPAAALGIGNASADATGDVTAVANDAQAAANATGDFSATNSLASLGANPSLSQLAAATPDNLVGDASTGDNSVFLGATSTQDASSIPSDLQTFDTSQFPEGYIEPPDPTTGLTPGQTAYTAAAGGGPVAGGGSGGGVGGWLSNFGSKLSTGLTNDLSDPFKLLGLGAAGYGLLSSLGTKSAVTNPIANETQLQGVADQQQALGTQLQSYLASGTLPPAVQTNLNLATQQQIQAIKAKYAANGMGPNSTAEQQDIAGIQTRAIAAAAQIEESLLTAGGSLIGTSVADLQNLLSTNTSLNNQTNAAIANLARALSGGGGQQFTLTPSNTNTTTAA
jgi:hypothetical protein